MRAPARKRALLSQSLRTALRGEILELLKKHHQTELGELLGVSQGAIWKAKTGDIGPEVAESIKRFIGETDESLLKKYGLSENDDVDPYPSRPPAIRWAVDALHAHPSVVKRLREHGAGHKDPGAQYWIGLAQIYSQQSETEPKQRASHPPAHTGNGTTSRSRPETWDGWIGRHYSLVAHVHKNYPKIGPKNELNVRIAIVGFGAEEFEGPIPTPSEFTQTWLLERALEWLKNHPRGHRGLRWSEYKKTADAVFFEIMKSQHAPGLTPSSKRARDPA